MKKYIVNVAVTDLRREPVCASPALTKDPLQESQVLLGEPVLVEKIVDGWARVHVVNQPKFLPNGEWSGYPGWIKAADLSEEGKENPFPSSVSHSRDALIERAHAFLGMPYLWGGRSPYNPESLKVKTGVDCSGLVHLLYQSIGIQLPRDAHDQFLTSECCQEGDLIPGDLIFSFDPAKSPRMDHVMLYIGNNCLIEAALSAQSVRKISLADKFSVKDGTQFLFGKVSAL